MRHQVKQLCTRFMFSFGWTNICGIAYAAFHAYECFLAAVSGILGAL